MVRFHDDVDGCGCIRCQHVDPDVLRHSFARAFTWSGRLPLDRPSILLAFVVVALLQLLATATSGLLPAVAVFGVLSVFAGRGYVGIVGADVLGPGEISPLVAGRRVVRRFPSFLGASLLLLGVLAVLLFVPVFLLVDPLQRVLAPVGIDPSTVELVTLVGVVVLMLYVLLKFSFVPEACFVGGYTPVAALAASWRLTTVHRAKVVVIVLGYGTLLVLGVLLETGVADPNSPVALTFRYGGTTVVIRSFGLSVASGFRLLFDIAVTAVYSGVFVHQYVRGTVES